MGERKCILLHFAIELLVINTHPSAAIFLLHQDNRRGIGVATLQNVLHQAAGIYEPSLHTNHMGEYVYTSVS